MAYQTVFKRWELKYLLTRAQKARLLKVMEPYMEPDSYGRTTVRNLYFDTESYRIIRRSLEKPVYKEKLRIRSYRRARPDSTVFVELKKKYDGIVYKRRLSLTESEALLWLTGQQRCPDSQIGREIDAFLAFYGSLRPTVFLSYEREAWYCRDDRDFRITFDENILCRTDDLSLESGIRGEPLLPEGMCLMELKCCGGIPLWLTRALTRERLYKTGFSKYGTAYETLIYPNLKGAQCHA